MKIRALYSRQRHLTSHLVGRQRCLSSSSDSPRVLTSIQNNIAHVEFNRESKLNAVDMAAFEQLVSTANTLKSDSSVRAVILSGKGRAFCTGLDVPSVFASPLKNTSKLLDRTKNDKDGRLQVANLAQAVAYEWRHLSVPVICVIHGMCFGAGLQIALGADLRIAAADSQLAIMETKWGLIPDMTASITLRELVRIDVAKELTFTGRIVSGAEAGELGLVTHVAATKEEAMQRAQEIASKITLRSPDAVALGKRLLQETWVNDDEAACLQKETDFQRKLLPSWNQLAASSRNFGWQIPYLDRSKDQ